MRRCLCLTVVCVLLASHALAAPIFDAPEEVLLTPRHARVLVTAKANVSREGDVPVCAILLPNEAQDFALSPANPDEAPLSWHMERVALPAAMDSALALRRAAVVERMDALNGQIRATQTLIDLWSTIPTEPLDTDEIDARATELAKRLPEATLTLARQEHALKALEAELADLPESPQTAQRVVLRLREGQQALTLRYAYTLPRCGWQPIYSIDATANGIRLRMDANITQYSGTDWKNTRLTLLTRADTPREPQQLRPWYIRELKHSPRALQRDRAAEPAAEMALAKPMPMAAAAPVYTESETQASWTLAQANLPEGVTRLAVLHEMWNDPVQRIARPAQRSGLTSQDNSPVWINAKHIFTGTPLPAGQAEYFLDGSVVGSGPFTPKGDAVTLFFGADPLLSVQAAKDTRVTGTSGIINKRQTYTWGWRYTVTNQRATPMAVRIEEAAPQVTDTAMTCSITSEPPAKRGEDHTVYWDVTVPARGKTEVRYAVSATAPQDMQLDPGR